MGSGSPLLDPLYMYTTESNWSLYAIRLNANNSTYSFEPFNGFFFICLYSMTFVKRLSVDKTTHCYPLGNIMSQTSCDIGNLVHIFKFTNTKFKRK